MSTFLKMMYESSKGRIETVKDCYRECSSFDVAQDMISLQDLLGNDRQSVSFIPQFLGDMPFEGFVVPQPYDILEMIHLCVERGIKAISVWTEPNYYGGNVRSLELIKKEFPDLFVIRRDVFLDTAQLKEAIVQKSNGIIISTLLLSGDDIEEFYRFSTLLGLNAMFSVGSEYELLEVVERGVKSILFEMECTPNGLEMNFYRKAMDYAHRVNFLGACTGKMDMVLLQELKKIGYKFFIGGEHYIYQNDKKGFVEYLEKFQKTFEKSSTMITSNGENA